MQRLHRLLQLGDRHRETQRPPEPDREQFHHHRLHQIGAKPPSSSDSFSPGSIHRTNSRSPPDSSINLIYVFREHHRPIDISSNDITPPYTHKSIHYPDRKIAGAYDTMQTVVKTSISMVKEFQSKSRCRTKRDRNQLEQRNPDKRRLKQYPV